MTSIFPNSQSYNFTHMFSIQDIRRARKRPPVYSPNTLMGIIDRNPCFSRFKYIIQLAELDGIYNDEQANFTLFVPDDMFLKYLPESFFTNLDKSFAMHIVQNSTFKNRITSELLEDSAAAYYNTMHKIGKLFISNISQRTYIDNSLNPTNKEIKIVKKDVIATNGVIHIVDKLIWPYEI
jgi:uncharacterized surface protein with fasciclin (FAS1) repeats